jgi:hypothetical protein
MKSTAAEPTISPIDMGVPSSSNWYPTTAFNIRIHNVAIIKPRWIPVKAYQRLAPLINKKHPQLTIRTLLLSGNFPTVKISQISINIYPTRKTCISLSTGRSEMCTEPGPS